MFWCSCKRLFFVLFSFLRFSLFFQFLSIYFNWKELKIWSIIMNQNQEDHQSSWMIQTWFYTRMRMNEWKHEKRGGGEMKWRRIFWWCSIFVLRRSLLFWRSFDSRIYDGTNQKKRRIRKKRFHGAVESSFSWWAGWWCAGWWCAFCFKGRQERKGRSLI